MAEMPRAQVLASRLMCCQRSSTGRPARTLTVSLRCPTSVTTSPYAIGIAPARRIRPRLPPATASDVAMTRAITRLVMKTGLRAIVCTEDLLDRLAEVAPDGERQRQRRQVSAGLDRVDRLARHLQLRGQLALAQAERLAQRSDVVSHAVKVA